MIVNWVYGQKWMVNDSDSMSLAKNGQSTPHPSSSNTLIGSNVNNEFFRWWISTVIGEKLSHDERDFY